jgi:hypothetical protein
MTKRILLAALLTAGTVCATSIAAEEEKGFVPIFNGKNLSGWEGEEGFWSVQDGAITGETTPENPCGPATYLMWRGGKAADFELRFAYRIFSGNSGVQFRSRDLENRDIAGYQADFDAPNQWTGCLYDCNAKRERVIGPRGQKVTIDAGGKRTASPIADPAELLKHVKKDDWNECHVIARGPEVTLKINGVVMSHVVDHEKDAAHQSGIFAIQLHGGPPMKVQVKNLRLKHLK